ncbi:MAG TPA: ABC transporter ATP-binding protein, partial [Anaerolineae bacterium]
MSALLEIRGAARYFGGLAAVKNVTIDIAPGEIVGLIGPNGAGKTTLLNLISGVLPLSEGEIRFAGQPLKGLRPNVIARRGIARTFQIVKPFPGMTVRENVAIGAMYGAEGHAAATTGAAMQRADEILAFLHLDHKAEASVTDVTIADRKRIEVARGLAMGPKLLLLDEVMAGLNPKEVGDIMALVQEINRQGITILVIEHVMRAIMGVSHRVLVLHHGQPIALGTPAEIAADEKVIAAYLGERFAARAKSGPA